MTEQLNRRDMLKKSAVTLAVPTITTLCVTREAMGQSGSNSVPPAQSAQQPPTKSGNGHRWWHCLLFR